MKNKDILLKRSCSSIAWKSIPWIQDLSKGSCIFHHISKSMCFQRSCRFCRFGVSVILHPASCAKPIGQGDPLMVGLQTTTMRLPIVRSSSLYSLVHVFVKGNQTKSSNLTWQWTLSNLFSSVFYWQSFQNMPLYCSLIRSSMLCPALCWHV